MGLITLGLDGETEFGWQKERYSDVWDKINFAYLQTISVGDGETKDRWLALLEEAIHTVFGDLDIDWLLTNEYMPVARSQFGYSLVYGYIDHQSAACEGENTDMFESKDTLMRFLFSRDSYIQCDNDNN